MYVKPGAEFPLDSHVAEIIDVPAIDPQRIVAFHREMIDVTSHEDLFPRYICGMVWIKFRDCESLELPPDLFDLAVAGGGPYLRVEPNGEYTVTTQAEADEQMDEELSRDWAACYWDDF